MRLLVDTDAFCKLAIGNILGDAAEVLGADLRECRRLPALPHMLRRGRLRATYGSETCDALLPVADSMPVVNRPSDAWLDWLTPVPAIDPGEAQIFALAAETGLVVLTGDKRALRALKDIGGVADALAGRIVVLEAILLSLSERLGSDEMRRRVQPLANLDKMIQVCFSSGNPDSRECLLSYYNSLATELDPLVLWNPQVGGAP